MRPRLLAMVAVVCLFVVAYYGTAIKLIDVWSINDMYLVRVSCALHHRLPCVAPA